MGKKGKVQHIGILTGNLIGVSGSFSSKLNQLLLLRKKWTLIAGKIVSDNINIVAIRDDKTLILQATSSVWMQEMSGLRLPVLKKIKSILPELEIKRIIVKIGKKLDIIKSSACQRADRFVDMGLTKTKIEQIDNCVKDVKNENLKQLLKRIFIMSSTQRRS